GREVERVGTETVLVGVQQHTAQAAWVATAHLCAAVKSQDDAFPVVVLPHARVFEVLDAGGTVDEEPARHAEAQADRRSVIAGIYEEQLSPAPQPAARSTLDRLLQHRCGEAVLEIPSVGRLHLRDATTDHALRRS